MKRDSKKLSVIVVVHEKYLPYLKEALDALRRQTLHDFETIIVANGCEWKGAIETVPVTLSEACNIGISQASGKYIVRLDADDWTDQNLLKELYDHIVHSGVDAVWCDYLAAYERSRSSEYTVYDLAHYPNHNLEHACGVIYRREVWESLDGYDETLKYQESYDFWRRFERAGFRAERLERSLYVYRRGHESMSSNAERESVRARLEAKYAAS